MPLDNAVSIRTSVFHQKCMRFNPDATVWVAKQRILCTLNQTLKDVLNYGLFQPPGDGQDGRFLDEERVLREYPQPVSKGVPSLEVAAPLYFEPRAALHSSLNGLSSYSSATRAESTGGPAWTRSRSPNFTPR